jgi:hypothetical protein
MTEAATFTTDSGVLLARTSSDAIRCTDGRPGRLNEVVRKASEEKLASPWTSGRKQTPSRPTLRAVLVSASTVTALIRTAAPSNTGAAPA